MGNNVTFKDLQELTGYTSPGEVAAYLAKESIPFKKGKYGRPWTTQAALDNAVLGVTKSSSWYDDIHSREIVVK